MCFMAKAYEPHEVSNTKVELFELELAAVRGRQGDVPFKHDDVGADRQT